MNFAELYRANKEAVTRALTTMWCYPGSDTNQADYLRQMRHLIADLFAPSNAVPLVQCMNSYKPVSTADAESAKKLVAPLWTAPYLPFRHQYDCWKELLEGYLEESDGQRYPMSICVTTGTGSGKTECFMMPLVKDLATHPGLDFESPSLIVPTIRHLPCNVHKVSFREWYMSVPHYLYSIPNFPLLLWVILADI